MRKAALLVFLLCSLSWAKAQFSYELIKDLPEVKSWTVDFSSEELQLSKLKNLEAAPEVGMVSHELKARIDAKRKRKNQYKNKGEVYDENSSDIAPDIGRSFNGRPLGSSGVPNDNTVAISNDGIIISAINTTVTILDSDGSMLKFRSLSGMVAGQLGLLDRYYDPKVLYDPIADRFILMFLEGSGSNDTRIIVGFSQTKDPTGFWNFYQISGRPDGGNVWSDYPIIGHNGEDLFITVNLIIDGGSWQEGFIESFIWQISKEDGYNGNPLGRQLYKGIQYKNKNIWSICPVQPATDLGTNEMYFLSVRPGDETNDTLFLHHINNSLSSNEAELSTSILTSNINYGVPPTAFQPDIGFRLQTNDTRVLSATKLGDKIHYVQSTMEPAYYSSGIYHGVIEQLGSTPTVKAHIISDPNFDYAYPSISYSGANNDDVHSMLITFSHVGENDYAGTSVVFHNGIGGLNGLYSEVIEVKEGDGLINTFVADTGERWGDYTDIQRKYNEPGVVWLAGSYGDSNNLNNVWLAEIKVDNKLNIVNRIISYPNPARDEVHVAANFDKDELVDVELVNMSGQLIQALRSKQVRAGGSEFLMNTAGLAKGVYILSIRNSDREVLHSQRILID